jgi:Ca-activated chloride channel family protein
MRKTSLVLFVCLVWLSIGSGTAFADGMLLPLPEAISPEYLSVRYHHVTVRIEDGHAVTQVEQQFYNPHDVSVAGRYLFPVPPDAILSRFEATVDGQLQQVERQDRAETNAALYAILAQQHDPSLLQYVDWESLAFDLTLPPGGSRVMTLEYEEVLAPRGGLYSYRYVLSTERYSFLPLDEVSVTVDLRSSSGLASVYSSSHQVVTERLGPNTARISWEAESVTPTEDFELYFAPAEGGYGGGLLTGERNGQGHFLFLFSPEAQPHQTDVLPKDIVFVIDCSGSMEGEKIEQARNALHHILGQLGSDDRFTIIGFDERLYVFDYALQTVEAEPLLEAQRYLDRLSAEGSTDLESALQAGLEILLGSEERAATRMVVFLTDGLPTAGITDEAIISRAVARTNTAANARLHVFGVGYDVNTHLLDRLAADNGGTVTYVQPGENLESALTEFYGKIAHPLLTDVKVEFEGVETSDRYPQALPDLFQGSSLLLAGRYRATGDTVAVRVRGWAGNERREYTYHFELKEAGAHDFVPRLWATRRAGALLDRVRVDGESQSLIDEIRELGLGYGIVTPYTTFVIEGQTEGAASAINMDLYDSEEVNKATGQVTIQARVQNQAYQQAAQANLAVGANVGNYGGQSVAQVGTQQVDLTLLQGRENLDGSIDHRWLELNVQADRTIEFGSEEYFALAEDPEVRPFLQSGSNVVFGYGGEVIAIRDSQEQPPADVGKQAPVQIQSVAPDSRRLAEAPSSLFLSTGTRLLDVLTILVPLVVVGVLLGLLAVAVVVRYAFKSQVR